MSRSILPRRKFDDSFKIEVVQEFISGSCSQYGLGSDITYIATDQGFCFLSLVSDAYTHQILGWYVAPILEAAYTLEALKKALLCLKQEEVDLIHHSDRGVQYASLLYTSHLKKRKIQISMTQHGDHRCFMFQRYVPLGCKCTYFCKIDAFFIKIASRACSDRGL